MSEFAPPADSVARSRTGASELTAGPWDGALAGAGGNRVTRDARNEVPPGDNIGVCQELLDQGTCVPKGAGVDQARPAALPHEAATEQDGTDAALVTDIFKAKEREMDYGKATVFSETTRGDDKLLTQDTDAIGDVMFPTASPVRIVVRCLSHKIPGPRSKRKATLADIVCRQYFQRDFDPEVDKISVMDLEDIDGKKVRFLLESGTLSDPTAMESVTGLSREVDIRTRAYLRTLPFKYNPPSPARSRTKSATEMRESMTDEEWNQYMQEFLKRRLQYEKIAGNLVKSWSREHPALFFDVMQEYVAQKRWHKLVLTPAEQQWVDAEKDKAQPASFLAPMETVLERMGKDKITESTGY